MAASGALAAFALAEVTSLGGGLELAGVSSRVGEVTGGVAASEEGSTLDEEEAGGGTFSISSEADIVGVIGTLAWQVRFTRGALRHLFVLSIADWWVSSDLRGCEVEKGSDAWLRRYRTVIDRIDLF